MVQLQDMVGDICTPCPVRTHSHKDGARLAFRRFSSKREGHFRAPTSIAFIILSDAKRTAEIKKGREKKDRHYQRPHT